MLRNEMYFNKDNTWLCRPM